MTDATEEKGVLMTEEEEDALALSSGFAVEKAPLWTLWKRPCDEIALTFHETKGDGSVTWTLTIDDENLIEALSGFLERNGAAAFAYVQEMDAHIKELERQLQAGLPPIEARDAALGSFTPEQKAEFARQGEEAEGIIRARIASGEFPDHLPPAPAP